MLRPILAWRTFLKLRTIYFFNFQIFLGRGEPQITETVDSESADRGAQLYLFYILQFYSTDTNLKQ
jgi:hypothetical protein